MFIIAMVIYQKYTPVTARVAFYYVGYKKMDKSWAFVVNGIAINGVVFFKNWA
ncbi:MAG: hypothetical protein HUK17_07915 [Bacteroidales bacterium]|nr:hypothetical protein [Bacteroidales bacterium]